MEENIKAELEQLKKLVGFKITQTIEDDSTDSFGFLCQKGKKKFTVWVDEDPEGNARGHLAIEEIIP